MHEHMEALPDYCLIDMSILICVFSGVFWLKGLTFEIYLMLKCLLLHVYKSNLNILKTQIYQALRIIKSHQL